MYKEMYYTLFNAITDSLEQMEEKNYLQAATLLKCAQRNAESLFLECGEDQAEISSPAS